MKKTVLFHLILILPLIVLTTNIMAQRYPDTKYGRGGSATLLNDSIFDSRGTLRELRLSRQRVPEYHLDVVITRYFDCDGNLIFETTIARGLGGDEDYNYNQSIEIKGSDTTKGERIKVTQDGQRIYERYDPELNDQGQPKGWRRIPPPNRSWPVVRPPRPQTPEDCDRQKKEKDTRTGCAPLGELFGGYSYLNISTDGESESLPVGAHLAFAYLVTKRFGLVADGSFHTKEENDLRITRAFLMGGLQYQLLRYQEDRVVLPFLRLLAGMAMDKQKFSSGSFTDKQSATAFALAFGLGLHVPLNRQIAAAIVSDYIRTNFNEDSQGNIRISAGLRFNLGCK